MLWHFAGDNTQGRLENLSRVSGNDYLSTQGFVRRTRVSPPRMPGGEVNLQAPPEVPRVIPGNLLMKLLPFVMIVAVVGMIALMVTVGGRDLARNPKRDIPMRSDSALRVTCRRDRASSAYRSHP